VGCGERYRPGSGGLEGGEWSIRDGGLLCSFRSVGEGKGGMWVGSLGKAAIWGKGEGQYEHGGRPGPELTAAASPGETSVLHHYCWMAGRWECVGMCGGLSWTIQR